MSCIVLDPAFAVVLVALLAPRAARDAAAVVDVVQDTSSEK